MPYTTIDKHSVHFNTKLYSGNGSNGNAQTGVGFQPDWTWIKHRNGTAANVLTDAVRGTNKHILTNTDFVKSSCSCRHSHLCAPKPKPC